MEVLVDCTDDIPTNTNLMSLNDDIASEIMV